MVEKEEDQPASPKSVVSRVARAQDFIAVQGYAQRVKLILNDVGAVATTVSLCAARADSDETRQMAAEAVEPLKALQEKAEEAAAGAKAVALEISSFSSRFNEKINLAAAQAAEDLDIIRQTIREISAVFQNGDFVRKNEVEESEVKYPDDFEDFANEEEIEEYIEHDESALGEEERPPARVLPSHQEQKDSEVKSDAAAQPQPEKSDVLPIAETLATKLLAIRGKVDQFIATVDKGASELVAMAANAEQQVDLIATQTTPVEGVARLGQQVVVARETAAAVIAANKELSSERFKSVIHPEKLKSLQNKALMASANLAMIVECVERNKRNFEERARDAVVRQAPVIPPLTPVVKLRIQTTDPDEWLRSTASSEEDKNGVGSARQAFAEAYLALRNAMRSNAEDIGPLNDRLLKTAQEYAFLHHMALKHDDAYKPEKFNAVVEHVKNQLQSATSKTIPESGVATAFAEGEKRMQIAAEEKARPLSANEMRFTLEQTPDNKPCVDLTGEDAHLKQLEDFLRGKFEENFKEVVQPDGSLTWNIPPSPPMETLLGEMKQKLEDEKVKVVAYPTKPELVGWQRKCLENKAIEEVPASPHP